MKVAPIFVSKQQLLTKLAKRNTERIKYHTNISDELPFEIRQKLVPVVDSMSRVCHKNHLKISFDKADGLFADNIGVTISKERVNFIDAGGGCYPIMNTSDYPIIKTIINPNESSADIIKDIKKQIKQPLENHKGTEYKYIKPDMYDD